MKYSFYLLILFLFLLGCVREPEVDVAAAWDQTIKDIKADTDTGTPDAAEGDSLVADDDSVAAFACLGNTCTTHDDCKKEGCAATFCSAELGTLVPNNPNACAVRCVPANNGSECPEGMVCNDQIKMAAGLGKNIDGAEGICAPPQAAQ